MSGRCVRSTGRRPRRHRRVSMLMTWLSTEHIVTRCAERFPSAQIQTRASTRGTTRAMTRAMTRVATRMAMRVAMRAATRASWPRHARTHRTWFHRHRHWRHQIGCRYQIGCRRHYHRHLFRRVLRPCCMTRRGGWPQLTRRSSFSPHATSWLREVGLGGMLLCRLRRRPRRHQARASLSRRR